MKKAALVLPWNHRTNLPKMAILKYGSYLRRGWHSCRYRKLIDFRRKRNEEGSKILRGNQSWLRENFQWFWKKEPPILRRRGQEKRKTDRWIVRDCIEVSTISLFGQRLHCLHWWLSILLPPRRKVGLAHFRDLGAFYSTRERARV